MFLKFVLIVALLGTGLVVAKEERVFERAGLVGYCQVVRSPPGDEAQWHGCREGVVTGFPRPFNDSCTLETRRDKVEYWRCPISFTGAQP
jgi:hypothetical protein